MELRVKVFLTFLESHDSRPHFQREVSVADSISFPFETVLSAMRVLYPTAKLISFEIS